MRSGVLEVTAAGVIALLCLGAASRDRGAAVPSKVDLGKAQLVDLSHPFEARTLYWPTSPSGFQLTTLHRGQTEGGFFYSANAFCAPEHGGTHLDAPVHFSEGGRSVDLIPLARLVGPAVVIDVSGPAAADPDHRLQVAEVEAWESRNGRVPEGAIALLRTGWGARWPERRAYLGDDTPGDASHLHFPSYGKEAARLLVNSRKVAALGVDTASIDHGPSRDFPVHQVAAAANVAGLENLTRLEALPERGAWVVALPMKIGGGSGGPLRAVGIVPLARIIHEAAPASE